MSTTLRTVMTMALVIGGLLAAPSLATGQQALSPEIVVSDLPNDQYMPQVAYNRNRNQYLVVWHNSWAAQARDVYGKLLDQWGNILDEFVISSGAHHRAQPSVAYDPVRDRYLVTWILDYYGDGSDWDVWGRIIPWNGPSASLVEFSINSWTSNQWVPKVAYAGTQQEFMVVWNNQAPSVPVYVSAQRIDAVTGALVGGAIAVASGAEDRINPKLAYNQARNEVLVVYQLNSASTGGDVYGVRMTAGGVILGSGEFAIAGWPDSEEDPAVGASRIGDKYVVAWHNVLSADDEDVYVWLLNGDGSFDGGPMLLWSSPLTESDPEVACDPESTTCLVAFESRYSHPYGPVGISAQTVGLDHSVGLLVDPRSVYVGEAIVCSAPAIAGGRAGWMVTWEHDPDPALYDDLDIHARVVFQLFGDGLESGDLSRWSGAVP